MSDRARFIGLTLGFTLAGLIALTVPFWIWPVDLTVQRRFFDSGQGGWFQAKSPVWSALYHFGVWPAIFGVLAALAVFALSFRLPRLAPWRKVAAYFVLCMLVGPGILINAGFKDHWGRPRPRDVEPFGGKFAHERVWTFDGASPGKSFPCGHCSMGFYFLAAALVVRRWRRALAVAGFALVFGAAIGAARIAQGGHFLSDVLWSGGFCLLTSLGLYFALGLDRSIRYRPKSAESPRLPPAVAIGAGFAACAAVILVLLATPYQRNDVYEAQLDQNRRFELSLILEGDEHVVNLADGDFVRVRAKGEGFGLPGSAIKIQIREQKSAAEHFFQLKQRRSGWFTELSHVNRITIPANRPGYVKIAVNSGRLTLKPENLAAAQTWRIEIGDPADVTLENPPENLDFEVRAADSGP